MEFEERLTALESQVGKNVLNIKKLDETTVKQDYFNAKIDNLEQMFRLRDEDITQIKINGNLTKEDVTEIKMLLKGTLAQELSVASKFSQTKIGRFFIWLAFFLLCLIATFLIAMFSSYTFPQVMESLDKYTKQLFAILVSVSGIFAFIGIKSLKGGEK